MGFFHTFGEGGVGMIPKTEESLICLAIPALIGYPG
jgi:hypothetical protein